MKNPKTKSIIFDLGNVILNIDIPRTIERFSEWAGLSVDEVSRLFAENDLFKNYETGHWNDDMFLDKIRQITGNSHWQNEQIIEAWNLLLLDIPSERIDLLKQLRSHYRLFLLSNTSPIHIRKVNEILFESSGIAKLDDLFEKVYYSYDLGCMKPDAVIYHKVLEDAGINGEECLFLDDNPDNIKGALAVGIPSIHVVKPLTIREYLNDYV